MMARGAGIPVLNEVRNMATGRTSQAILILTVLLAAGHAQAQDKAPLELTQTIPMEGVQGKIDHLSVDVKGKRLFVATTANNSVQVIDLAQGKVVYKI
ncbi:MAG: hypothetical protein HY293_14820, partial [Planctomycetes bacterium]|nr:hypothetical protein [Planctomycetota bacterium]